MACLIEIKRRVEQFAVTATPVTAVLQVTLATEISAAVQDSQIRVIRLALWKRLVRELGVGVQLTIGGQQVPVFIQFDKVCQCKRHMLFTTQSGYGDQIKAAFTKAVIHNINARWANQIATQRFEPDVSRAAVNFLLSRPLNYIQIIGVAPVDAHVGEDEQDDDDDTAAPK